MKKITKNMQHDSNIDFESWSEEAYKNGPVVIYRDSGENVVLLSEQQYKELVKTKNNADYMTMLDISERQIENGESVVKTLEELEEV